jgi:TatD DNase family protein
LEADLLVDTHCHLNDPSFEHSLDSVIAAAIAQEVSQFIVPAYDADSLERTRRVVSSRPSVLFPTYGIHPWYVNDSIDVEALLQPYLGGPGVVAIGEIGLDFVSGCPPLDQQIPALKQQLGLAIDLDLPVIIHCRKAHEQLLAILQAFKGSLRGVMHSYSGSTDLMFRFLDLGLYIAFGGSVTRHTARKYHNNAKKVPLDRLLLETDTPSIATESTVASLVEPRHVVEVAEKVAELRSVPYHEICARTTHNARLVFRLPSSTTP